MGNLKKSQIIEFIGSPIIAFNFDKAQSIKPTFHIYKYRYYIKICI